MIRLPEPIDLRESLVLLQTCVRHLESSPLPATLTLRLDDGTRSKTPLGRQASCASCCPPDRER